MARIAVVSPFPPIRGGIAQFAARASDALRDRGHLVDRVSFRHLYPAFLRVGASQTDPAADVAAELAADVAAELAADVAAEPAADPTVLRDPSAVLDGWNPLTWKRAGDRLRRNPPDVVLAAYWTPLLAPAIGVTARASGAPVIGLLHNAFPHERLPGSKAAVKWFLRGCDGVMTLSEKVEAQVRELGYDGPLRLTPHPIYDHFGAAPTREEARRDLGMGPDHPLLLFFGLVRSYKGLDVLIEAMALVRDAYPEVRLLVAGEWVERRGALQRRMAALGLERTVIVEDRYVPDLRVPLLFAAADLLVLPYRSGTQSGVLSVAAAYGVPAVVTDVAGLAAPIRSFGAGAVAQPSNPASLAAAILSALRPESNLAMRDGMRRLAGAGEWSAFAESFEGLLHEVHADPGHGTRD